MEAREICRRTAVRLAEQYYPVVIGPVLPFGASSFHPGYPGTVSIKPERLIALIRGEYMHLYKTVFAILTSSAAMVTVCHP
jgi:creatinine amidohydrolase/Fe(II)-dependent formamide hydrolase-like protein